MGVRSSSLAKNTANIIVVRQYYDRMAHPQRRMKEGKKGKWKFTNEQDRANRDVKNDDWQIG